MKRKNIWSPLTKVSIEGQSTLANSAKKDSNCVLPWEDIIVRHTLGKAKPTTIRKKLEKIGNLKDLSTEKLWTITLIITTKEGKLIY